MPAPSAVLEALLAQHQEVLDQAIRVVAATWRIRGPDREDFRQDVLVEVLTKDGGALRRCRGGRGRFSYFRRIAFRVGAHRLRSQFGRSARRRDKKKPIEPPAPTALPREDPHHRASAPAGTIESPPIEIAQTETFVRRVFERAFCDLPNDAQGLLALRFALDRSVCAIARAAGRSRPIVTRRITTALAPLHATLLAAGVHRDDAALAVAQQGLKSHFLRAAASPEDEAPSQAKPLS